MFQGWAPMRAMIEIEWIDGHVTRIPELALGDAFGESVPKRRRTSGSMTCRTGLWSRFATMSQTARRVETPGGGRARCTRTASTV